jgi:hypothetical protein
MNNLDTELSQECVGTLEITCKWMGSHTSPCWQMILKHLMSLLLVQVDDSVASLSIKKQAQYLFNKRRVAMEEKEREREEEEVRG